MLKKSFFINTTPEFFGNWLSKHTLMLSFRPFPTEKGRFCLQRSRPADVIGNPGRVSIDGVYSYTNPENSDLEIALPSKEVIWFNLIPLSSDRTEIEAIIDVNVPSIETYFRELLEEIGKRWFESGLVEQPGEHTKEKISVGGISNSFGVAIGTGATVNVVELHAHDNSDGKESGTTQPEVDNDSIQNRESALETARRALAILEQQAAGYTSLTIPAHLKIELEDKRKEVAELEADL
ncbi:MAG: hypothetical protein AB1894_12565 [Chloroflexota bacterium]